MSNLSMVSTRSLRQQLHELRFVDQSSWRSEFRFVTEDLERIRENSDDPQSDWDKELEAWFKEWYESQLQELEARLEELHKAYSKILLRKRLTKELKRRRKQRLAKSREPISYTAGSVDDLPTPSQGAAVREGMKHRMRYDRNPGSPPTRRCGYRYAGRGKKTPVKNWKRLRKTRYRLK